MKTQHYSPAFNKSFEATVRRILLLFTLLACLEANAQVVGTREIPASQQVTLQSVLISNSGGTSSSKSGVFYRQNTDGLVATNEFVVPAGKVLVVTDVQFLLGGSYLVAGDNQPPIGSMSLRIKNIAADTEGIPQVFFSGVPSGEQAWQTSLSGIMVSSKAKLVTSVTVKGQPEFLYYEADIIVRGYLAPER